MKSHELCIQMWCCSFWEMPSVRFFTLKGLGMHAVYQNNKSLKYSWEYCQKCWMNHCCFQSTTVSTGFSREGKSASSKNEPCIQISPIVAASLVNLQRVLPHHQQTLSRAPMHTADCRSGTFSLAWQWFWTLFLIVGAARRGSPPRTCRLMILVINRAKKFWMYSWDY